MLPDRVMRGKEGSELQARHGVFSGLDFLFVEAARLRARRGKRNRAVSRAAECSHAERDAGTNFTREVIAALHAI
ncbi:hypothetical protein ACVOMS_22535 [Bradyrhizobium guangxiense]|jgi:hypothetical protein